MPKPPEGKKVLNTQISEEEHGFLREMAKQQKVTMTNYLRSLIRGAMNRTERSVEDLG